ncbi:uncharacterized protein LOC133799505 [Humulus lupulus]|uniref:uncharacterized protein LOC133799505 n=1 Tax=Humulus lupulus TaxID=3486 RepID=UPI002B411C92|nr:uncharacterized protein LOC133799505 [Humulus lupulus]
MGVLAKMWVKMRDKVELGNFQTDSSLHDPGYESLLQQFLPSQQQGSTSNQSLGMSSIPQQPQQNSLNISGGSSQSPLFNYMFGLSSQFPQTQPMGSQFGGLPQQQQQQQQPMYSQFRSFMQQQPVYPHYGGSTQQPVYNQQYYTTLNQQQQQSPLIRPQPRPYYPSPPAPQSHEGSAGNNIITDGRLVPPVITTFIDRFLPADFCRWRPPVKVLPAAFLTIVGGFLRR